MKKEDRTFARSSLVLRRCKPLYVVACLASALPGTLGVLDRGVVVPGAGGGDRRRCVHGELRLIAWVGGGSAATDRELVDRGGPLRNVCQHWYLLSESAH